MSSGRCRKIPGRRPAVCPRALSTSAEAVTLVSRSLTQHRQSPRGTRSNREWLLIAATHRFRECAVPVRRSYERASAAFRAVSLLFPAAFDHGSSATEAAPARRPLAARAPGVVRIQRSSSVGFALPSEEGAAAGGSVRKRTTRRPLVSSSDDIKWAGDLT